LVVSTLALTRRAGLAALGAIFIPAALGVRGVWAQPGARFRDIVVDVRADLGEPTVSWLQQALPGAIAQALGADYAPGDRNGATLVARIDHLYLGPSSGGVGPAGASQDTIKGALIVRGPRGGIDTPLRAISFYYPMAVDQALPERAYHDRVIALAQAFAGWVPRQLGLAQG
jgi:hypothetical protein